ncbi:MAG: hypothetical protein AB7G87_03650 [Clostridia bacterium]
MKSPFTNTYPILVSYYYLDSASIKNVPVISKQLIEMFLEFLVKQGHVPAMSKRHFPNYFDDSTEEIVVLNDLI